MTKKRHKIGKQESSSGKQANSKKREKILQRQGLAEHKSDKMSNQKKGKKGVVQGVTKQINRKITTNKQKITTKQRKIYINKSKMSLVGRRESSKGSAGGKYGRRGQKRRAAKSGNAK